MSLATLFYTHLTVILSIVVVILGAIWLWIRHTYSYWKRHNVPYIEPYPFFGNIKDVVTLACNPSLHFQKLYNNEKTANEPVVGIYVMNKPVLLIRDVEIVKNVLVKDFNKFSNRFSRSDPHKDIIGSNNLLLVKNPRWKELRVKLTPTFSSGKLKQMYPLIDEIGIELDKKLRSLPDGIELDIKEINALYTTDVIGTIAFGIRANSLENPDGEFRRNGKRIFEVTRRRTFDFQTLSFWPQFVSLFRVTLFSNETTKFIRDTITYIIEERIKSGLKRNDLIDTLVEFKKMSEIESDDPNQFRLIGDALVAQASIFFSAGFEPASSTMSFTLYELSKHFELQQRLREEIRATLEKNNGLLTYESVQEMPYMQQVLQEVLRLYPTLPFLDRECTLNANEKSYSLKPYSDFEIPHGMPVFIPGFALQRDPKYFPNPDVFDPERFAPANKEHLNMFAYMPFGIGPHSCLGERFGLLQTKVGLVNFLRNHYVTPGAKSPPEMVLNPRAFVITSKHGIYCNIVRDPLLIKTQ